MRLLRIGTVGFGVALAACGGGGGGGDGGDGDSGGTTTVPGEAIPTPTPPLTATPGAALSVDCSGEHCGAQAPDRYAGQGVGLWRYDNVGTATANVPVSISGLAGKMVTLLYSNQTSSPVLLPNLPLLAQRRAAAPRGSGFSDTTMGAAIQAAPRRLREFDPARYLGQPSPTLPTASRQAGPARASSVGSSRPWYVLNAYDELVLRHATLQRQLTAPDGRVINFWVQQGELADNRLSNAMLDRFVTRFAGGEQSIYARVTGMIGQPWGLHGYSSLLSPHQELDVVFANFHPDRNPYIGWAGYFWALNNFKQQPDDPLLRYSNQSLSFYIDTETIYLLPERGVEFQLSTLAHELTHMINAYQRGIVLSSDADHSFETVLEETTALMTEDIVGTQIDPSYHVIRDDRFRQWMRDGDFNCSYPIWQGDPTRACFSYNVAGSFGAYLVRHYGVDFYRNLLRDTTYHDAVMSLDHAIRQAGGPGYVEALRRWGVSSIGLLPASASPAGFGLPERNEAGFTLPALDGADYADIIQWPGAYPTNLTGYGHFPMRRNPTGNGVYQEILPVPGHTSLTVIVQ
ncbi:M30 family zinc metallopeptidase [Chitiniphilus shinanonensis]|uniref:M30 family zinc metallopeptidase n=1 Tax=Chitiniphilus shinanonensis TaxID=553088 RepID=UPI00333F135E